MITLEWVLRDLAPISDRLDAPKNPCDGIYVCR